LQNRRAAAEALGRIGDKTAVPALLAAAARPADRVLEHALTFALIEIADPRGTAAGLESPDLRTRRAALMALDQMEGGGIAPEAVAPDLTSSDPAQRETAAWIAGRHPEWGDALAGSLRGRLAAPDPSASDRAELERQLARFARAAAVQDLLAAALRDASTPRETRLLVLRAMAQAGLMDVPKAWVAALAPVLAGDDVELIRQAVATARAFRKDAGALSAELLRVARRAEAPVDVRLDALAAMPGGLVRVDPDLFAWLQSQLGPDRPVATRVVAAEVLSRAKLTPEQLGRLAGSLQIAGPLEIERLLAAFAPSTDEGVGLTLVAALQHAPARSTLRIETLEPLLAKFGARVRPLAEDLYATLREDRAQQTARLETLSSSLADGDVRRGQEVFNSPKAACASCHAIGYLGGKVGPDLTRIGQIRSGRDLLEAIAFPSASFVRSYEPVTVATKDGRVTSGVLRADSAAEVVLATGANQEARIARDDIEEMQPGTVSVMPAGLDQQLTPQELADLVAFLKACR
jgi:putative heme-binding domain-containing protein